MRYQKLKKAESRVGEKVGKDKSLDRTQNLKENQLKNRNSPQKTRNLS